MRKEILIFSYDYPPSDGGIARLCHEIAVGAKKYYEKVVVLTRKKIRSISHIITMKFILLNFRHPGLNANLPLIIT